MAKLLFTYLTLLFSFIISLPAQQLSIQTGHSASILDLEFSPNGKILASCGSDNKIVIWDLISSKQMNILSGHSQTINQISIHPTKNIIASASDDSTIRIWEYPSGNLIKTYSFFNEKVKSVVFNPNGNELACGTKHIFLINTETDKHIKLSNIAKKSFNAIAYNKVGEIIAFGEKSARLNYIYDIKLKTVINTYKIKSNQLLFDNDNSFLYIAGKKGILSKIRISKEGGKNSKQFKHLANYSWNSFNSIAISKDYIFAANKNKLIYVYNKNNGKQIETLKAHSDQVKALAISPTGNLLASAGKDRKIIIWNTIDKKIVKVLEGGAISINSITFSDNGNTMFIAYGDGSFKTWDLKSKSIIKHSSIAIKESDSWLKKKKYTTRGTIFPINSKKLIIKVNKIKLDKTSDKISKEYENIISWNIKTNDIKKNLNNKSNTYQNFFLIDTSNVISIKINATYSQKYSLLNHQQIKDRETVTSIIVNSCKLTENKKKLKIKKEKSFKISGDIYLKNVSKDGKQLIICKYLDNKSVCEIWNIITEKKISANTFNNKITYASFSPKHTYISICSNKKINIYNKNTFELIYSTNGIFPLNFSQNEKYFMYSDLTKNIFLYDLALKKLKFQIQTKHQTNISDITYNDTYNYIATSSFDGLIKFWDINSGSLLISMAVFKENDFIYVTPENYYFSTKNAMNYIGFLFKDKLYSFEQFDLKYNRPDIVFAKTGYSNEHELMTFNKAYLKRIKKLGFNINAFESDFDIPSITIKNTDELPIQTIKDFIDLKLNLSDSSYNIDRLNIWINDVAIYGLNGFSLKDKNSQNIDKNIKLELAQGNNKIQVSCLNMKGAESYKETINITYEPKQEIPQNLYLITIGTSKYKDSLFNLQYAAKDAQDIVKLFTKDKYFDKVITKTLTNEQVTKKNISDLKNFLSQATINDQVIIFVAGHGVLDTELDYYLASYPMDFKKPKDKGIAYESVEMLLDGIKPLKKILFVDACHSGEIDKDEMELAQIENTKQGEITFRAAGANVVSKTLETQSTSELTKELFTDLRRGTGATVVSSAGGGEYAMESGKWKNGLFTYCLINGIQSKEADLNKDGKIMLSELQKYVQSQVLELSGGKQKPTSRIENISSDFRVW